MEAVAQHPGPEPPGKAQLHPLERCSPSSVSFTRGGPFDSVSSAASSSCGHRASPSQDSSLGSIVCAEDECPAPEAPPQQQEQPARSSRKKKQKGGDLYGVSWQRYSVATYVSLPLPLRPFVRLPGLRSFLVVGKPTFGISGGLAGYRAIVSKRKRRKAPFLMVVDTPGAALPEHDKYHWIEVPLPEVFQLDVSGFSSFEDYVQRGLKKSTRRAYRVRQEELEASPIEWAYVALGPGDQELVDQMWALYLKNGERHGFRVLSKKDFYRIHLGGTPGLAVMLARDASAGGALVTFSTGVRCGDTLMSMWCGTDYDNEWSRRASTYINSQYRYIRLAIEDPEIRWLDCGAQMRQMKTNIGCSGYPVRGYVRCRNKAMKWVVGRMMAAYFHPEKFLSDA